MSPVSAASRRAPFVALVVVFALAFIAPAPRAQLSDGLPADAAPAAVALPAAGASADDALPSAEEVLTLVRDRFAGTSTLSARFRQDRHTPLLTRPIRSEGVVHMRGEPLCVVFDLTAPRRATARFDATSYQVFRPEAGVAERYLFGDSKVGALVASVLAPSKETMRATYETAVSWVDHTPWTVQAPADASTSTRVWRVDIRPATAEAAASFQAVALDVEPGSGRVLAMRLDQGGGEAVHVQLAELREDAALPAGTFAAEVPSGTTVRVINLDEL